MKKSLPFMTCSPVPGSPLFFQVTGCQISNAEIFYYTDSQCTTHPIASTMLTQGQCTPLPNGGAFFLVTCTTQSTPSSEALELPSGIAQKLSN
jgi:hypothetical protein